MIVSMICVMPHLKVNAGNQTNIYIAIDYEDYWLQWYVKPTRCNKFYFYNIYIFKTICASVCSLSLHRLHGRSAPFVFSKRKLLYICRKRSNFWLINQDYLHLALRRQISQWLPHGNVVFVYDPAAILRLLQCKFT